MSSTSATDTQSSTSSAVTQPDGPTTLTDLIGLVENDLASLPPSMRTSTVNRLRERGLFIGANPPSEQAPEQASEQASSAQPPVQPPVQSNADAADTGPGAEVPQSAQDEPASVDPVAAQIEQMKRELDSMKEQLRVAEARYSTLRGKYDAETAELRRQIAMMQVQVQSSQPAPASQSSQVRHSNTQAIRDQLVARYGQDFDETTVNFVSEAVELAKAQMMEEMQRRLTELQNVAMNTQQQALEVQLDNRIPGWREVAQDPRFAAWLDEPDPFSGLVRREVLTRAIQNGQTDRIVTVFDTYRRTQTAELPVTSPGALQASTPTGVDALAGAAPPVRPRAPTAAVPPPRPRGSVAASPATGQTVVTPEMLESYRRRAIRGQATEDEYRVLHEAIVGGSYRR